MIDRVDGVIEAVGEDHILLRTGPLVLRLLAPAYFLRKVRSGQGLEAPVYLHLQMEGNRVVPLLVAFPSQEDRGFFERFISVSGVGVRGAVKALARPASEIAATIARGDVKALTVLPGIGRARAKTIVAKLQDSLAKEYPFAAGAAGGEATAAAEAASVLRQLGLDSSTASDLARRACEELGPEAESGELVKLAMRLRGT